MTFKHCTAAGWMGWFALFSTLLPFFMVRGVKKKPKVTGYAGRPVWPVETKPNGPNPAVCVCAFPCAVVTHDPRSVWPCGDAQQWTATPSCASPLFSMELIPIGNLTFRTRSTAHDMTLRRLPANFMVIWLFLHAHSYTHKRLYRVRRDTSWSRGALATQLPPYRSAFCTRLRVKFASAIAFPSWKA